TSGTASMQDNSMSFLSEFSELYNPLCVLFLAFTLALVAYPVGTRTCWIWKLPFSIASTISNVPQLANNTHSM
ncbi:hypothetical protein ACQ4M3_42260, partial [Leptolyngbya sp. AN03gr2]|uniref:hypothetical protein n=1 Tax=unclassified Leptolyngbya TaxID=2650499 RepID=UPI003D319DE8